MNATCCHIDCLPLGIMQTNTYIVHPTEEAVAWVIDPGMGDMAPVLEAVARERLTVERILLTHGHGDHIAGVAALARAWPDATITAPAADAHMLCDAQANLSAPFGMALTAPPADELIEPGRTLSLGATTWEVLDTSGHSPGGRSLHCPDASVVFTGDALFSGSIGRTDFPGSDSRRLIDNIRRHLLTLPADTAVYSGHGPATTIRIEQKSNPYLSDAISG